MTTKHSLFTRGLSLVLAFVMVLGNLSGFAMETRAAEGNLFELIAANDAATSDALNKILQNAEALPKLAALNTQVSIEEAPEEVAGHFYEGELKIKAVGNWVPASYIVGGDKVEFDGYAQIEKGDFVGITYKLDVNADEDVKKVYNYIAQIGGYAAKQLELLNLVSTPKSLVALDMMDGGYEGSFVDEMKQAVDEMELSDIGFELPTVEEIKAEIKLEDIVDIDYNVDYNEDGVIDEADKEYIENELWTDAEVQEKIEAEIEKRLAEAEAEVEAEFNKTKAEYKAVIAKMDEHILLDVENEHYLGEDYLHFKYKYPIYENKLRIYAMMAEYDEQGLAHYFEHADEFHAEMEAMSGILKELLGEKADDGTYANGEIVSSMLLNMGYGEDVTLGHLADMAVRMENAAKNLPALVSYISDIDMTDADAVDALFFAENNGDLPLICKFNAAQLDPTVYVESAELLLFAVNELVHNVIKVEAVEPGCHMNGVAEHWYCTECETVWADEAQTQVTNHKNVTVPATGEGNLVHIDAVEAGCHMDGNIEYWVCYDCEQVWQDEALTQLTNIKNVIAPAVGGEVVHVPAVAPTATENGNIEYWYCESCEQVWQDEALTQLTNHKNVIRPALGDDYTEHNLIHVEAVEASCHMDGVAEHWYCTDCETVWADEALTLITNHKNVIIPATGEGNLVHMEAVEPGCHMDGNIEYWVCYDCEQVWQDEALTQLTNIKNVIAPAAGGEVVHVPAVAPTATENGNIEYWYCESCEQVWQDEALTQLTNIKNVILPARGEVPGNTVDTAIQVEFTMNEEWTEGSAQITVEPGVWYYMAYGLNGMAMTINGEPAEITAGMYPMMPATFVIENNGTAAAVYNVVISYPVGSSENPAELAIGDNVATVPANSWSGYVFTWKATADGTLVLTMPAGDWMYTVNNFGTDAEDWSDDRYGDTQWSDSDPVVNPANVAVKKGETLQIIVNTYDPTSWNTPAGDLVINAAFKAPVNIMFAPEGGSFVSAARYPIGYALTEEDLLAVSDALAAAAEKNHQNFDLEAFKAAYVGYVITKAETLYYEVSAKEYAVTVDGAEVLVPANKDNKGYYVTLETLGYASGLSVYVVNVAGEEIVVADTTAKIYVDIETMAAGDLVVNRIDDALNYLVDVLNEAGVAGKYEVVDGTLMANVSSSELIAFFTALFEVPYETIVDGETKTYNYYDAKLNGENFLFNRGGMKISIPALMNAMLHDEAFTSENLIKMSNNGKGEFLHTTLTTPLFEVPFVITLTSTPGQLNAVANYLEILKPVMTFEAHDGNLHVDLDIPEKAYEAYVAALLVTGQVDKSDKVTLSNLAAMNFLMDYINVIKEDAGVTSKTYNNTLELMPSGLLGIVGVADSLSAKDAEAIDLIQEFIRDTEKFNITLGEKTSDLEISARNMDIDSFLSLMYGKTMSDFTKGVDLFDDQPIDLLSYVNIVNEVPEFDAAVIDPTQLASNSKKEKAMFADMTTDLVSELKNVNGVSAIMLMDDINGTLTFNHAAILDLNGHTINGGIVANAKVIVMDSSLNTVSGAKVTGSVSGDAIVLAGTYAGNVSSFLRDGYYQDSTGAVKNAMYEFKSGKLMVNPRIYIDNVDGYLPAVQYLAADVALDLVLNYYTAAALYANGKDAVGISNKIYDIHFEDLIGVLGNKDVGTAVDQVLNLINTEDLSDFINKIIADLLNVDKIAACLSTGETISTYSFAIHPWQVNLRHIDDGDYLTLDVVANEALAKSISFPVALQINTDYVVNVPHSSREYTVQQILDELARIVVTEDDDAVNGTQLEIMVNQPVRDGKTLVVGGSANAIINLDFSHNSAYNWMLAAVLSYFNDGVKDQLIAGGAYVPAHNAGSVSALLGEGSLNDLNTAMSKVTVGDFFGAINDLVQSKEIPFSKIVNKLNLDVSASKLAQMEKAYDKFQATAAKVVNKFDLDKISKMPMSELANGEGVFVLSADLQPHYADAFYKGFGVEAELDYTSAKLIVKLAVDEEVEEEEDCLWGDADHDGIVDQHDASLIFEYFLTGKANSDYFCLVKTDVDGNGEIDQHDATLVFEHFLGKIDKFPVEE